VALGLPQARQSSIVLLQRHYNADLDAHWVSTRPAPGGYAYEGIAWDIVRVAGVAGTAPLFGCKVPDTNDQFLSRRVDCEGMSSLGQEGYVFMQPDLPELVPLHRCYRPDQASHFVTQGPGCEGAPEALEEGVLGYVFSAGTGVLPDDGGGDGNGGGGGDGNGGGGPINSGGGDGGGGGLDEWHLALLLGFGIASLLVATGMMALVYRKWSARRRTLSLKAGAAAGTGASSGFLGGKSAGGALLGYQSGATWASGRSEYFSSASAGSGGGSSAGTRHHQPSLSTYGSSSRSQRGRSVGSVLSHTSQG
jgi:hypothetical protein